MKQVRQKFLFAVFVVSLAFGQTGCVLGAAQENPIVYLVGMGVFWTGTGATTWSMIHHDYKNWAGYGMMLAGLFIGRKKSGPFRSSQPSSS